MNNSQAIDIGSKLDIQQRTKMFDLLRRYYRTHSFLALQRLIHEYGFSYDNGVESGENQGVERGQENY